MERESPLHPDATVLVNAAARGDTDAANRLLPLIYEQLKKAAQVQMASERPGHTLSATALVHEAYMRLIGDSVVQWRGRGHFYVAAAEAMRRILIEHARSRGRIKRGAGRTREPINVLDLAVETEPEEILSLDEAICRLESEDKEMAGVVRLRFYAGLSVEDTAEAMGISPATVKRKWSFARAWLFSALRNDQL